MPHPPVIACPFIGGFFFLLPLCCLINPMVSSNFKKIGLLSNILNLRSWRRVFHTTLCDKVYQLLAASRWFYTGTPVFSANKTDSHSITDILLKVALDTITLILTPNFNDITKNVTLNIIILYFLFLFWHLLGFCIY